MVHYYACQSCGFIFTDSFDCWTQEQFKEHIYNEDYIKVDPGYKVDRPLQNAARIMGTFYPDKDSMRILDWGGGNGFFAAALREAGFPVAETYDPFTEEFSQKRSDTFNFITCYETIEHVPNPLETIAGIAERLATPGIVLFTTLLQPSDIDKIRLGWWYVGPRNGHISLFSAASQEKAWASVGLNILSLNDSVHLAFREVPSFARHVVEGR
jgi:2-polyprenyl-6-hydroxyphenyl methylase/3-demethylubiquinone-9 3-methyltransferase